MSRFWAPKTVTGRFTAIGIETVAGMKLNRQDHLPLFLLYEYYYYLQLKSPPQTMM